MHLHRQTGMFQFIRLIPITERPLAWQFQPKRETPACSNQCISCQTAMRPTCCYTKNAVYLIYCQICQCVYVGQSRRILEHTKSTTSHVFAHMQSHGPDQHSNFKWKIACTHPYLDERTAIESLIIKRQSNLMNGCEGINTLSFL
jgi:hypothetical protein